MPILEFSTCIDGTLYTFNKLWDYSRWHCYFKLRNRSLFFRMTISWHIDIFVFGPAYLPLLRLRVCRRLDDVTSGPSSCEGEGETNKSIIIYSSIENFQIRIWQVIVMESSRLSPVLNLHSYLLKILNKIIGTTELFPRSMNIIPT